MATLSVVRPGQTNAAYTLAAAGGSGDVFQNSGREILLIRNDSGSNITLTVATPGQRDGVAFDEYTATLADGVTYALGPFPAAIFNNASSQVSMTYSSATSLTLAIIGEKANG